VASFVEQTGISIATAFRRFDEANPQVYERFKQLAFHLIQKGKRRYSSKTILCVLRYEVDLQTTTDGEYKINDAFTSRYARKFVEEFPEHAEFFEMRELRTKLTQGGLFGG
jgi:hypothetical protein